MLFGPPERVRVLVEKPTAILFDSKTDESAQT